VVGLAAPHQTALEKVLTDEKTAGERIIAALDALGIEKAHFGTGGFAFEMMQLSSARPGLVGSVTLVTPTAAVPAFASGNWPILGVFGASTNPAIASVRDEMIRWEQVLPVELPSDYDVQGWSDVITDHAPAICAGIRRLASTAPLPDANVPLGEQEIEEIRLVVEGSGPPLVLIPSGLWPSQWAAALPELTRDFTVIRLGGRHLGPVSFLELRAAGAGYMAMVDGLFDRLALRPGETVVETVVEVGTGSGALSRRLARRVGNANTIIGTDLSASSVEEAAAMARDLNISWRQADATALPFEDGTIDVVFSVTVLEECDVEPALDEMHRVLHPGGRAGVIVRAVDLPVFWNLDLPEGIEAVRQPVGGVSAGAWQIGVCTAVLHHGSQTCSPMRTG
jgi:SAM-dependent methyltransferase